MTYVELHAHSAFSFGDGASLPDELALAAAEQGHGAMALTDHDGIWGSMEFAQACSAQGVRPITGAELTVTDGGIRPVHLTLLVEDAGGYSNLCRLITEAHRDRRPTPDRDPLPPSCGSNRSLSGRMGWSASRAARGRARSPVAGNAVRLSERERWATD